MKTAYKVVCVINGPQVHYLSYEFLNSLYTSLADNFAHAQDTIRTVRDFSGINPNIRSDSEFDFNPAIPKAMRLDAQRLIETQNMLDALLSRETNPYPFEMDSMSHEFLTPVLIMCMSGKHPTAQFEQASYQPPPQILETLRRRCKPADPLLMKRALTSVVLLKNRVKLDRTALTKHARDGLRVGQSCAHPPSFIRKAIDLKIDNDGRLPDTVPDFITLWEARYGEPPSIGFNKKNYALFKRKYNGTTHLNPAVLKNCKHLTVVIQKKEKVVTVHGTEPNGKRKSFITLDLFTQNLEDFERLISDNPRALQIIAMFCDLDVSIERGKINFKFDYKHLTLCGFIPLGKQYENHVEIKTAYPADPHVNFPNMFIEGQDHSTVTVMKTGKNYVVAKRSGAISRANENDIIMRLMKQIDATCRVRHTTPASVHASFFGGGTKAGATMLCTFVPEVANAVTCKRL